MVKKKERKKDVVPIILCGDAEGRKPKMTRFSNRSAGHGSGLRFRQVPVGTSGSQKSSASGCGESVDYWPRVGGLWTTAHSLAFIMAQHLMLITSHPNLKPQRAS